MAPSIDNSFNLTSAKLQARTPEETQHELERYRTLFEQLTVGAHIYRLEDRADDRSLRMVAANPVVEALTGVGPANLIGRTLDESFPGLREQGTPQAYAEVVRSGAPFITETVYGDAQVVTSAFAVRALPLPNDEVAVLFENITQRKQAELALRKLYLELGASQNLLRNALDASPYPVDFRDLTGHYLLVNQQRAELVGYTPAAMLGKSDYELFPSEVADRAQHQIQRVVEANKALEYEETVILPTGSRTFLVIQAPVADEQGAIYAVSSIFIEITEQIKVREQLWATQDQLKSVLDSLPMAVFWKSHDLVYQGCNQHFAQFAGLSSPDQVIGKTDYELPTTTPAEADFLRSYNTKVMEADRPELQVIDDRLLDAEGQPIWLSVNLVPLHDADGTVNGILGAIDNITAQKRAELALRDSERLLATLFDHLPTAIFLKEVASNKIVLWNSACAQLHGRTAAEVIGKSDYEIFPPQALEAFRSVDQAGLTNHQVQTMPEVMIMSPTQGEVVVSITVAPILNYEGEIAHILVTFNDLREQRQAANERAALQNQIIEAQQHALRELSTPLLPLSNQVVLMPLIGAIDSQRAQQVTETLLKGVATFKAQIAIIDITGVQVVDTQVANAFIQAARAVQLLGAQVMLTGIRPEVAQTLVQLGVDLQGVESRGSLQAGIAAALQAGTVKSR